jgi:hypothetical protein
VQFAITPLTDLFFSGTAATHRFALAPRKNSDATEFSIGGIFKPGALVSGEGRIGYLRHLGLDEATPDLETVIGTAKLSWDVAERTRLGLIGERSTGNVFQPEFAYNIVDRGGLTIRQGLTQRFDTLLEAYLEKHRFKRYAVPPAVPRSVVRPDDVTETNRRFAAELGVRLRAVRVGIGVTYIRRFSLLNDARRYNVIRAMMNVSYGVFQARAL